MKLPVLVSLVALLGALPGQQKSPPSQEKLIKLRSEKLAKPVFQKAKWVTDYDQARAGETGRQAAVQLLHAQLRALRPV